MMPRLVLGAGLAAAVLSGAMVPPFREPHWQVVADIPLPGSASRFDYQSLDTVAGRLWISHIGAGEVLAIDVRSRRVVARVTDLPGATGILAVPALGRVFVSLSGARAVAVLDAESARLLARVQGGGFPDGLDYAPPSGKVFVSDEQGRQELVIDAASSAAHQPIPLEGEAGNTRYDSRSGRLWVAVQTRGELVAIDPEKESVTSRVPVPGVVGPHGFQLDPVHERAYVTGQDNDRLAILDLRAGRVLAAYPVGHEPDVVAFDPGRARLFVGSEGGVISAFNVRGDSLVALPSYRAPHAHSVAVDPSTHLVYAPLERIGGVPILRVLRLE